MGLEPKFVDVSSKAFGRLTVHYREMGAGPPLLLVHGLMTTSYSWRYVFASLAQNRRVIALDLVGCGRTDKPAGRYGPREVAAFIAEFSAALGIRGCDVVGNSMGGYLCMVLALDDPGAMRRLVNIHSPGVPMARLFALRAAMALPGSSRLLHALINVDARYWVHKNVHYWDEAVKSLEEAHEYGDPLRLPEGSAALAAYLRDTLDPRHMRSFVRRLQRERFGVPLSLIYAKRDPMVPPWVGERLAALVPDAELLWLDDCSHFAHVDRPDALADAITAFVS